MSEKICMLGIETSCDETAVALVTNDAPPGKRILADAIKGQDAEHSAYGGIVPEIAARTHIRFLDRLIDRTRRAARCEWADIDAVAVTAGPGLIGGLVVGTMTGWAIARALGKPLYPINHLEGHALSVRLEHHLDFPWLLVLMSGGHTQIVCVENVGTYHRIGTTLDDALGEAFDKTARMLGLGFPGGPAVEAAAKSGDPARFDLPRPMIDTAGLDMSFAGLKSAVRRLSHAYAPLDKTDICDICAAFQCAVSQVLAAKAARAIACFRTRYGAMRPVRLVVAGGVAANHYIRAELQRLAAEHDAQLIMPAPRLCTDNGAMIAWAAIERREAGVECPSTPVARARWPLDMTTPAKVGSGRRGPKV